MQATVGVQIEAILANSLSEGFHIQSQIGVEWIDAGWDVASTLASSFPDFHCLICLGFPGAASMSFTHTVLHFMEDNPHGNQLFEYFLLNPVTFFLFFLLLYFKF